MELIKSLLLSQSTDMQKFPLRMKDNDLLVTELYKDPTLDHITAISVYLTPKTTSKCDHFSIFPLNVFHLSLRQFRFIVKTVLKF